MLIRKAIFKDPERVEIKARSFYFSDSNGIRKKTGTQYYESWIKGINSLDNEFESMNVTARLPSFRYPFSVENAIQLSQYMFEDAVINTCQNKDLDSMVYSELENLDSNLKEVQFNFVNQSPLLEIKDYANIELRYDFMNYTVSVRNEITSKFESDLNRLITLRDSNKFSLNENLLDSMVTNIREVSEPELKFELIFLVHHKILRYYSDELELNDLNAIARALRVMVDFASSPDLMRKDLSALDCSKRHDYFIGTAKILHAYHNSTSSYFLQLCLNSILSSECFRDSVWEVRYLQTLNLLTNDILSYNNYASIKALIDLLQEDYNEKVKKYLSVDMKYDYYKCLLMAYGEKITFQQKYLSEIDSLDEMRFWIIGLVLLQGMNSRVISEELGGDICKYLGIRFAQLRKLSVAKCFLSNALKYATYFEDIKTCKEVILHYYTIYDSTNRNRISYINSLTDRIIKSDSSKLYMRKGYLTRRENENLLAFRLLYQQSTSEFNSDSIKSWSLEKLQRYKKLVLKLPLLSTNEYSYLYELKASLENLLSSKIDFTKLELYSLQSKLDSLNAKLNQETGNYWGMFIVGKGIGMANSYMHIYEVDLERKLLMKRNEELFSWISIIVIFSACIVYLLYEVGRSRYRLKVSEFKAGMLSEANNQLSHFSKKAILRLSSEVERGMIIPKDAAIRLVKLSEFFQEFYSYSGLDAADVIKEIELCKTLVNIEYATVKGRKPGQRVINQDGVGTLNGRIPALVIFNIIYNAFDNGNIADLKVNGTVRLTVLRKSRRIKVSIFDTGIYNASQKKTRSEYLGTGQKWSIRRLERNKVPLKNWYSGIRRDSKKGYEVTFTI